MLTFHDSPRVWEIRQQLEDLLKPQPISLVPCPVCGKNAQLREGCEVEVDDEGNGRRAIVSKLDCLSCDFSQQLSAGEQILVAND